MTPNDPATHAAPRHEPIVAALGRAPADLDVRGVEREGLVAACAACADVLADASHSRTTLSRRLPTPARPRDFRLTRGCHRASEPIGRRAASAVIGSPRDASPAAGHRPDDARARRPSRRRACRPSRSMRALAGPPQSCRSVGGASSRRPRRRPHPPRPHRRGAVSAAAATEPRRQAGRTSAASAGAAAAARRARRRPASHRPSHDDDAGRRATRAPVRSRRSLGAVAAPVRRRRRPADRRARPVRAPLERPPPPLTGA